MYKHAESALKEKISILAEDGDPFNFLPAFRAALAKQEKYIAFALRLKYSVIGAGKLRVVHRVAIWTTG